MKEGYAYEIYKIYKQIFPKVTMRSIYYHLKKGTSIDEFKVKEIRKEKGTFSWGSEVEKTYFELGTKAEPKLKKIKTITTITKKFITLMQRSFEYLEHLDRKCYLMMDR